MEPLAGPPVLCHVLLVEHHSEGLILVDTGFSRKDLDAPARLGPMRHLIRPQAGWSAADAIERAGFSATQVTHVVFTHLDLDHVGGADDLPNAVWHTTADEWRAATRDTRLIERPRYRSVHFRGDRELRTYSGPGDHWMHGLTAHEVLPGVNLIPMPGHTRGHAAVSVTHDDGIIVHAGDAVFDGSSFASHGPTGTPLTRVPALRAFEWSVALRPTRIAANHEALGKLNNDPTITVINAHDTRLFPGDPWTD